MSTEPKVNPEDFTAAEHAAVDAMAAPLIRGVKFKQKFLSQNREAQKRMNRPEKEAKMEAGADIHLRLIDKANALWMSTQDTFDHPFTSETVDA